MSPPDHPQQPANEMQAVAGNALKRVVGSPPGRACCNSAGFQPERGSALQLPQDRPQHLGLLLGQPHQQGGEVGIDPNDELFF
ncbi:MAG: hypothetical protein JXB15_13655 [Anaerolineales bacterium]|nr:hypothetical protein [Anaerolineales bacterium]